MTPPESEVEPRRARSVMQATPKVSSRGKTMDPAGERRDRRRDRGDRDGEREGRDRDRVRRKEKPRSRS